MTEPLSEEQKRQYWELRLRYRINTFTRILCQRSEIRDCFARLVDNRLTADELQQLDTIAETLLAFLHRSQN